MVATKALQSDVDDLDAIAEQAGVNRSDVARAGLELVLRGPDRATLVEWLAQRGRESSAPLTEAEWQLLRG